jgi:antitoxin (DNA-binding transcriptional repressor) of toxin-antitoxin stability system
MYQVQLEEAKNQLLALIRAAIKGEQVLILIDDQQMVQLVPFTPSKRHPKFGSAKGMIFMSADFDAPLPDFAEYTP